MPSYFKGALETEVDVLALLAYERREGGRQPATPADGAAHMGECIEASPAQYVARPPLTADAELGVEEISEDVEMRSVHRDLFHGPLGVPLRCR